MVACLCRKDAGLWQGPLLLVGIQRVPMSGHENVNM